MPSNPKLDFGALGAIPLDEESCVISRTALQQLQDENKELHGLLRCWNPRAAPNARCEHAEKQRLELLNTHLQVRILQKYMQEYKRESEVLQIRVVDERKKYSLLLREKETEMKNLRERHDRLIQSNYQVVDTLRKTERALRELCEDGVLIATRRKDVQRQKTKALEKEIAALKQKLGEQEQQRTTTRCSRRCRTRNPAALSSGATPEIDADEPYPKQAGGVYEDCCEDYEARAVPETSWRWTARLEHQPGGVCALCCEDYEAQHESKRPMVFCCGHGAGKGCVDYLCDLNRWNCPVCRKPDALLHAVPCFVLEEAMGSDVRVPPALQHSPDPPPVIRGL
ncbi:unnamed protein product [Amoebophrya sp. A120]|nr:unnamed protein product [Amoebophrya sp. A120]|eukprot:GSA120T00024850001.1